MSTNMQLILNPEILLSMLDFKSVKSLYKKLRQLNNSSIFLLHFVFV